MTSHIHNNLTGSKFINMCVANWLLHIFIYASIPVTAAQIHALGGTHADIGWSVLAFAIGMFLPGPFGAHIMERRSRKSIYLRSLLILGPLACVGYSVATEVWMFIALQMLQGVAFGLSQTALGTTLVNDILLSKQRNKGDIIYGWAGRLGIPLGFMLGFIMLMLIPLEHVFYWMLIPCALSFILVAQTNVPIKAPVKVPFVTLDRFFLPQSMMLCLSMFAAPWLMGRIASYIIIQASCDAFYFICVTLGVFMAFLFQMYMRRRLGQRTIMTVCYAFVLLSLLMHSQTNTLLLCVAYVLAGCGIGGVSSRHLMDWVTYADHCQRGTAQNTYMLCWRMCFSIGFMLTTCGLVSSCYVDIVLAVLSCGTYLLWAGNKNK